VAIEGPSKASKISPRVRPLRRAKIRLATASAPRTADTATKLSKRRTGCSSYLVLNPVRLPLLSQPPLYSTTISQAIRNALRGSLYEARRERTSENSVKRKLNFGE
jgi:hypothetical protein